MNVLIVDDHELIKEGVQSHVIKVFPEAKCYFANTIRMAVSIANTIVFDLVLCDLEFNEEPEMDGFYFMNSLKGFESEIKVIALTNYNSYRIMNKAITSGFHSFLEKGCSYKVFSETLLSVHESGYYESVTMKKLRKKRSAFLNTLFSDSLYGITSLSDREKELTILSATTTDRNILAVKMNVSPYTIDTYFKKILVKLNLKHRQELSMFSYEFKNEILK